MSTRHTIRIRLAAFALGAAVFLIPVSLSPGEDGPATVQEACATDGCCPEIGSFCDNEGKITPNASARPSTGCQPQDT